jgi:hypothetical protein
MTFTYEFPRDRDCYVLFKGDSYTVSVSADMRATGWQGGQGVKWVDSTKDEFLVSYSDGIYGGFMLWGSNEVPDILTGLTGNQPEYGFGTFCAGGWLIATRTVELYTYASRIGGGPLVPISYRVGERLLFSLRGYWTNESEWQQEIPPDPRGVNGFYIGNVVQAPSSENQNYIVIQTSI